MIIAVILVIAAYTFLYPIVMSYVWIIGGVLFTIKNYKPYKKLNKINVEERFFTVVVPMYNEEDNIIETIKSNLDINYTNYELLLIDDHSTDSTANKVEEYMLKHKPKNVRFIKKSKNTGKANTLNYSLDIITSEWFLCIDSDARLEKNALSILNKRIEYNRYEENIVAYTGTPKLVDVKSNKKDKSYKLKLIQQLEYRQIIGMIKRSQMFFAKKIMTVSGVCVCYKTQVIKEIGGFDSTNATEDIEITWRIYNNRYSIEYFPLFIVYMYTPDTLAQIINQRARWALGGIQTSFKYKSNLTSIKPLKLAEKFFSLELIMSSMWVLTFFISAFYALLRLITYYPEPIVPSEFSIPIILLLITNILLTALGYYLEYGTRERILPFIKHIWYYPLVYWLITPLGFINGYIEFLKSLKSKSKSGVWRNTKKINMKEALIKSIFVDVFCYSLMLYIIRAFATKYVRSNQQLESLFIPVLVVIILYTYLSYRYWFSKKDTLGNRLFNIKIDKLRYILFFRIANILTTMFYYYYTYQLYFINTREEEVIFITDRLVKLHAPNYIVMATILIMIVNILFFKTITKYVKEIS